MKGWIAPLMLGFGVAMAVMIGQRMSTDAMAVVIGVAVGVVTSIPTSLLLVALLRRESRASMRQDPQPAPAPYAQLPLGLPNGMNAYGMQMPLMMVDPMEFQRQMQLRSGQQQFGMVGGNDYDVLPGHVQAPGLGMYDGNGSVK